MKLPTMRIALLLSCLAFAACTVGEVGTANNNNPDGGGSNMDGGADPNACATRVTPPDPKHLHAAGGTSNQGQNCIVTGCHLNNTGGGPGYQFAGTVYAKGTTTGSPGALVRIVSGTTVLKALTDEDGNFAFPAGSLPGAFMATTNVTACPTVTPMATVMQGGTGAGANSCNLCHNTTGAGVQAPPITL